MTNDTGFYRTIDANANRASEALRVVGDIVRFVLNDETMAASWRGLRSELWDLFASVPGLQQRALQHRDSPGDAGREFKAARHTDLPALVRSNIHRAQEAFRVLEELFRCVDLSLVPRIARLRYCCYDREPAVLSALQQWSVERQLDFGLYVVLGQEFSKGRDFLDVSEKAIDGGAGAIQLRAKDMPIREFLDWACRLRELTRERGVTLIVNDRLDVALAAGADGVHLGQDDFPIVEARRIAGPHFILGASTHSVEEAKRAAGESASYINIGPLFATNTKKNVMDPIGPDSIGEISAAVDCPFTVMGGIKLHNVDEALRRGARRIAVVTEVVGADDITEAAQAFTDKIQAYKNQDTELD